MILIIIIILIIIYLIYTKICTNYFSNIKNPFKIDIVYTWAGENNDQNDIREAYNNELKYSLRSVFKNVSIIQIELLLILFNFFLVLMKKTFLTFFFKKILSFWLLFIIKKNLNFLKFCKDL